MRSRRSLLNVALIVVPAVLIALAVFVGVDFQRISALRAVTAEEQAQRLLTAMLDQETGARGYFVTRDRVFLQPWYSGTRNFTAALGAAERMDAGDGQLLASLRQQAALARTWHQAATGAIDRVAAGGRVPTVADALARKGVMDSFRSANSDFRQLLSDRRNAALFSSTLVAAAVALVLAGLLALGGVLLIRGSRRREDRRRRRETELRELLQASQSEDESRLLLIRHIKRVVPGAGVAVLNRNNSDDRLEPTLDPAVAGTPLAGLPDGQLQPRSCLAVRLSRPHERRQGEQPLAECEVCGKLAGEVACEPLLVGGKVIGSVLLSRRGGIPASGAAQMRAAVVQAAPIIANQRNLSLAEMRAASDPLTGLPNRRAADDTLKRMAAHAGRTLSPLSAILVDLDHFKSINDLHGHEMGDEVLATIGHILSGTIRESDFAARYGGEEFLLLLPDTSRENARGVAEKLRRAVAQADVRCGQVTASFGVATLPDDALHGDALVRRADGALYQAKHGGRDRVELALPRSAGTESDSHR